MKPNEQLLNPADVAKMCKLSAETIRRWVRTGRIKTAKKVGNTWLIPANFFETLDARN